MKKLTIVVALSLFAASSAFGAVSLTIDSTMTKTGMALHGDKVTAAATSPLIGKTSTGVALGAFVSVAGTGYSMITQHKNGTKIFGSSYDSTSMYSAPILPADVGKGGGNVLTVPTAITSVDYMATGWSSL